MDKFCNFWKTLVLLSLELQTAKAGRKVTDVTTTQFKRLTMVIADTYYALTMDMLFFSRGL